MNPITAIASGLTFFSSLSTSDKIQFIAVLVALTFGIITSVISVATLIQNGKMIEESSRPVISIYSQGIFYNGHQSLYLVVKNLGASSAHMTKFNVSQNFINCYGFDAPRNYIDDLSKCIIAPGQSRICHLDQRKLNTPVHFSISYYSNAKPKKVYSEDFDIDLKAAALMPREGPLDNDKSLDRISTALEGMLFKDL